MIFRNTLIAFCPVFMFLPAQCQILIDSLKALLTRKWMVYFLIWFGMVFPISNTYGQNQKIVDSLNAVLVDKIGGERYLPLYELAFEYIDVDNEKALEIIQQAEKAALLTGDSLWIVKSMRVKGQVLYKLERTGESIKILTEVLPIAIRKKFTIEWSGITQCLASSYLFQGQYDMALKFCFETLQLANQLDDPITIGRSIHNIGVAYYKLTDYKKALFYFKKSLTIPKFNMGYYALMNIGLCYAYMNDFKNAQIYIEQSLKTCRLNCFGKFKMEIRYAMGLISFGLKDYEKAENQFLTSYLFANELNNSRYQFDNIYFLADIYMKLNQINKAEHYLLAAEALINRGTPFNLEMLKIYSRFYQLYSLLHNFKKVAYYQAKYIQLKDNIYNDALTTNLMKIESDYQERDNNAKIVAQNEIIILKEEVIVRQRIINLIVGFLIFISIAFLILIFRNLQLKKNLNRILDKKIEERTRELQLSRDELLKTLWERDIRLRRASEAITRTINTISGLCRNGVKEFTDPAMLVYLTKIDETSHQLTNNLKFYFEKKMSFSSII